MLMTIVQRQRQLLFLLSVLRTDEDEAATSLVRAAEREHQKGEVWIVARWDGRGAEPGSGGPFRSVGFFGWLPCAGELQYVASPSQGSPSVEQVVARAARISPWRAIWQVKHCEYLQGPDLQSALATSAWHDRCKEAVATV